MEEKLLAWAVIALWLLPLAHVALSPRGGRWRPPPGSGCPLGPRVGWLVLVLLLGPLGWLMFWRSRKPRRQNGSQPPSSPARGP